MPRGRLTIILCLGLLAIAMPAIAGTQPMYEVHAKDITQTIARHLEEHGYGKKIEASLYGTATTLMQSASLLEVALRDVTADTKAKRWHATMDVFSDKKLAKSIALQGRFEPLVKVPVLARSLYAKDIIGENDITIQTVAESKLRGDTLHNAQDLIGKALRRPTGSGKPLHRSDITNAVMVRKGTHVEIRYTAANMQLTATGVALEDGAIGKLIRVKNDKSGKAVTARILEDGRVEANLAHTVTLAAAHPLSATTLQ